MSGSHEEDDRSDIQEAAHDSPETTPAPSIKRAKYARTQNAAFPPEQSNFLLSQFPLYLEHIRKNPGEGVRGTKNAKGTKKSYVMSTLFPAFKEEFRDYCSGQDKTEMIRKISRFMSNRLGTKRRQENRAGVVPTTSGVAKKPRMTNAYRIFESQNKEALSKAVSETLKDSEVDRDSRLTQGNKKKKEIFLQLSPNERERLEQEAAERNQTLSMKPSKEQIFENQRYLGDRAAEVLHALRGDDWGQFGEFVYFTIGAYRNSIDDLKLFYFSGGHEKAHTTPASNFLEDPSVSALKVSFTRFANNMIPVSALGTGKGKGRENPAVPRACVILDSEREPLLPEIDFDQVMIEEARQLLKDYFHFAWVHELYGPGGCPEGEEAIPPPWEALHSLGVDEGHYLADVSLFLAPLDSSSPNLTPLYSSLNPQRCSNRDVVQLLKDIFRCQNEYDVRIIVFKMNDHERAQLRHDAVPDWFSPRTQSPVPIFESGDGGTVAPEADISPRPSVTQPAHSTPVAVEVVTPVAEPPNDTTNATPPSLPTSRMPSPQPVKATKKRGRKSSRGKSKSTESRTAKTAITGPPKAAAPRQRKPPPPPRDGSRRIHSEKYTNTAVNVRAARQA